MNPVLQLVTQPGEPDGVRIRIAINIFEIGVARSRHLTEHTVDSRAGPSARPDGPYRVAGPENARRGAPEVLATGRTLDIDGFIRECTPVGEVINKELHIFPLVATSIEKICRKSDQDGED